MAVNKVEYFGNTLIDLTSDTLINSNQLLDGVVAHTKDGNTVIGTYNYQDIEPIIDEITEVVGQ